MTAARKTKPRSPEYLEQRRNAKREERRIAREARGFASVEEMRKFAAVQAAKTRAARLHVIQPSIAKRNTMVAANVPGQTVEDFLRTGGKVEVLPTYWDTKPGPAPARFPMSAGARAL